MTRANKVRQFTVDLEASSLRYQNMITNITHGWNGGRTPRFRTKHISEVPYDVLFKNKRRIKRTNKVLTEIRLAIRWNKEKNKHAQLLTSE